ncbi:helix-turn-helix transcriptional regulator [Limimaricola cinnabarinus]|uniref:helix-turn-helix transcriptional regulator n=1 Tax=Limimaricola cinnabarinus TaxID=1125964 RepID=UPI002490C644|nr:response regulator transcription factor [Limimaricola cinnabarinus]
MTAHIITDNFLLSSAFSKIFSDLNWTYECHRVTELDECSFEGDDDDILLLSQSSAEALTRAVESIAPSRRPIVLFTDALNAADVAGLSQFIRAIVPTDATEERIRAILMLVADGHTVFQTTHSKRKATGGQPAGSARQVHAGQLTNREMEILHDIAQGYPNKTIARRLQISANTVQVHASAIFRKLDVDNRTQAARVFNGIRVRSPAVSARRQAIPSDPESHPAWGEGPDRY